MPKTDSRELMKKCLFRLSCQCCQEPRAVTQKGTLALRPVSKSPVSCNSPPESYCSAVPQALCFWTRRRKNFSPLTWALIKRSFVLGLSNTLGKTSLQLWGGPSVTGVPPCRLPHWCEFLRNPPSTCRRFGLRCGNNQTRHMSQSPR